MDAKAFVLPLFAGIAGYFLFYAAEGLIKPPLGWRRPIWSWLASAGIWFVAYGLLTLLLGRPFCALGFGLALEFILIVVNNAKYKSLDEPFLFQDYDYFLDTLKFPRLFLPFLGWKSFCLAALFCLVALAGILAESVPFPRFALGGQLGSILCMELGGAIALYLAGKYVPKSTLDPLTDLARSGFIPFLWTYGRENRHRDFPSSPFTDLKFSGRNLPHLVAFQSESYFDARVLTPYIQPNLYEMLEAFQAQSLLEGELIVPARGANTVRTEFSFLSGLDEKELGPHKFNPYHALMAGWTPFALPLFLKNAGYKTICIHPYHKKFYGRNKIFPRLGFDEFIGIEDFSDQDRAGPYTGDITLGKKITGLLQASVKPTFIFAISMENHGPLHLEKPGADTEALYQGPIPAGCGELAIYLNHVRHTEALLANFLEAWQTGAPVSLCFYGDHIPILPGCYKTLLRPSGQVPYFCWSNTRKGSSVRHDMRVSQLAKNWLGALGLIDLKSAAF